MTAWQSDVTGEGSIVAVIDTGLDDDSPEFAGRVHPLSADVTGAGRPLSGVDDHGTNVSLVAAAALDGAGVVGIAFDAQVLALRADGPGTCESEDPSDPSTGCTFRDTDIAAGVDRAVQAGATVLNLSLGGSSPSPTLRAALQRAVDAGIVIVVSAGNDADEPDAVDPTQPDPFAVGALAAGGGSVIIVGSVNENNQRSAFSNAAGNSRANYITARGERICCVYEDGQLLITTDDNGNRFVTLFSGTSFSAPQVSGAVALLAQAFPNLTAQEIVEIILTSAQDLGAAGVDEIFGHGVLDIAAALAPSGSTSIAGTSVAVAPGAGTGGLSRPMGDAHTLARLETVLLDKYDRAYGYDLAGGLRGAQVRQPLGGALASNGRQVTGRAGGAALAFTVGRPQQGGQDIVHALRLTRSDADAARVLAAQVALQIAPATKLAFGFRQGADGLSAQLQGASRPAFLVAQGGRGDGGFAQDSDAAVALRHAVGPWGVTVSAQSGEAWSSPLLGEALPGLIGRRFGTRGFGIALDRTFGSVSLSSGASWLQEDGTVLGARLADNFGAGGADTLFFDNEARWSLSDRWRLGLSWREGLTRARAGGLVAPGSRMRSRGFAMDLERGGVFQPQDSLAVRISQPLRVESGGIDLSLPVDYDYATESAIYGIRTLTLSPTGREMQGELAWRGRLWGGSAAASLFYRNQPGHIAEASSDAGVALRWSRDF